MTYSNIQPSRLYRDTIFWGVLCWIGIIVGTICAIVYDQWGLFGAFSGCYYGAFHLFMAHKYKYLSIQDYNGKSLRIQFGHYSGSYSIILPYSEIVSLRKSRSKDYGCCTSGNECICGNGLTLNKNGTKCCAANNDYMIEIHLKSGWKQCGQQIYVVRVSSDDLNNLIEHIKSQNANVQIIDFMQVRGNESSAVNLKMATYRDIQPSPLYYCTLYWGIMCWFGILSGTICAILTKEYFIFLPLIGMFYGAMRLCRVNSYKQLSIEQYDDKILRIQFGFYSGSYSIVIPYAQILSVRKVKSSDYGCLASLNECVCAGSLTLNANGTYCCEFSEQFMIEIQLKEGWKHSCQKCGSMIFTVRISTQDLDNLITHIFNRNSSIDIIDFDGTRTRMQKDEITDLRVRNPQSTNGQTQTTKTQQSENYEGSNTYGTGSYTGSSKETYTETYSGSLELEIGDGDIYTAVNTNDQDMQYVNDDEAAMVNDIV